MLANLFGKHAEDTVAQRLQKEDFKILEQNYKKFFGEIDIIAEKEDMIVFVEVKARKNPKSSMFELVTYAKQQKIIKVAQEYIARQKLMDKVFRFDVALIECKDNKQHVTTYIENAFY